MDQVQKIIIYLLASVGSFFGGAVFSTLLDKPYLLDFNVEPSPPLFSHPHYNLNSVTEEELCSLQGIGPLTAKKILNYRNTHFFFKTIDELKKVPTIGTKKFNKVKGFFFVKKPFTE